MSVRTDRNTVHACRLARVSAVLGLALCAGTTAYAQPDDASGAGGTVSAVWQPYELDFHYFGTTTHYSCSGLEHRLEQMLRAMGADKDVHASVSGCYGPSDIGKMLSARIRVRMPTASNESQAQTFSATSKVVTLRADDSGVSGSGDCELLEQVRDQILPALKLQLVREDLGCIPWQGTYAGRSLQVRALLPEPIGKQD